MKPDSGKLIITAAICGAEVSRDDNPNLPLSPEELAADALACERAGASVIHLHVRDGDGRPTQNAAAFRAAMDAMAETGVTAVIQPSTGGAAGMSAEQRIQPVSLKPEMASLDCGTLNFGDEIFVNDMPLMRNFAGKMRSAGTVPELECFEAGHVASALRLAAEGLLPDHLHFNLVFGVPGAMPWSVANLLLLTAMLPPSASWTASAVGRHQLPAATQAILLGGHARVGFEDNIYYAKGVLADSNAQLVARVARIAGELGRPLAAPDEARAILGIAPARGTGRAGGRDS
jgi:3-keto-5-aminohexanoate cleavage enzyme